MYAARISLHVLVRSSWAGRCINGWSFFISWKVAPSLTQCVWVSIDANDSMVFHTRWPLDSCSKGSFPCALYSGKETFDFDVVSKSWNYTFISLKGWEICGLHESYIPQSSAINPRDRIASTRTMLRPCWTWLDAVYLEATRNDLIISLQLKGMLLYFGLFLWWINNSNLEEV